MVEKDTTFLERLGVYFLVFIFISILFEIGLFAYAYFNAEEVECNLLWCTFKSGEIYSNQECYINSERVNCSEIKDKRHFCNDGLCEMNGVIKPDEFYKCITEKGFEECMQ